MRYRLISTGPGDNFDLGSSHVVPALLRKVDDAKRAGGAIEIWGTGSPRREFLYVDDAADALALLLERYSSRSRSTSQAAKTSPSPNSPRLLLKSSATTAKYNLIAQSRTGCRARRFTPSDLSDWDGVRNGLYARVFRQPMIGSSQAATSGCNRPRLIKTI